MIDERGLTIPEELLLLALEERSGRTHGLAMFGYGLGGGILAELLLRGRVRLEQGGKESLVQAEPGPPTGDPVLDAALERVRTAKRPRPPQGWVQRFASTKDLKHDLARGLCRKGILRAGEESVLLLFTRKVYPEIDPGPERELVERLRRAVFEEGEVDPHTAILAAIASKLGLLAVPFDKKELKARAARLEELERGDAAVTATGEAIGAAQVALMTSISASMVAVGAATA